MLCRRLLFLVPFFLFCSASLLEAQDKERLRKSMAALVNAKDDTNKVINLDYVAWDTAYDNLAAGLKYGEEGLLLAEKLKFDNGIMYLCNTLGTTYSDMGNLDNALKYHLRGLAIAEKIGRKRAMGTSEMNISTVYTQMKEYGKALQYLRLAEKHFSEINFTKRLCVTYNGMGECYLNFPDSIERALWSFNEGLQIATEDKKFTTVAISLSGIAKCYHIKGDTVKSDQAMNKVISIMDTLDSDYEYSMIMLDFASILTDRGHYRKAENLLLRAREIFRKIGMREKEVEMWKQLAIVYEKTGEFEKSIASWKSFTSLKDSVLNEKVFGKQKELEAFYENEKKENEIKSLKQEKQITELDLAKRIAEKERLNVFITLGIIALLLVIGFAVYIYFSLQQKKKSASMIEMKNREITDSINYSRRIQTAILPDAEKTTELLGEHFIFYLPKDIVSGDFYFAESVRTNDGKKLIAVAAADCTGHGVPGAFMSIFGYTYLKQSLKEKEVNSPGDALDFLNRKLGDLFQRSAGSEAIRDGMDISFCVINPEDKKCWFAGANNPLWHCRNGAITEIAADRQPIGFHELSQPFTNKTIELQTGDMIYLFTDGFADQFGGPQGKKFKYKQLKELLISVSETNCAQQHERLKSAFENWQGTLEQVDDVLVIGIRI